MGLIELALPIAERLPWPDAVSRAGVSFLVGRTSRRLAATPTDANRVFAAGMAGYPIAEHVSDANAQHYEVPARFFELVLGPQRKYSCCHYDSPGSSLAQAEESALALTAEHATLADGQSILELGCGWGSLSLWMAQQFPAARITAVSNSHSQRAFIIAQAAARGLLNLDVITADMNQFIGEQTYDRIVSVEMFEHMSNWDALLRRVRAWLRPDGRLFFHVFTHRRAPYRFDRADKADWIAQHFFTGGIMPSEHLIDELTDGFAIEARWRWGGAHYARTAEHWLSNFDNNADAVSTVLRETYGKDTELWCRRWRLFFLATSGLFGYRGGEEWGVSHYRLRPL